MKCGRTSRLTPRSSANRRQHARRVSQTPNRHETRNRETTKKENIFGFVFSWFRGFVCSLNGVCEVPSDDIHTSFAHLTKEERWPTSVLRDSTGSSASTG